MRGTINENIKIKISDAHLRKKLARVYLGTGNLSCLQMSGEEKKREMNSKKYDVPGSSNIFLKKKLV